MFLSVSTLVSPLTSSLALLPKNSPVMSHECTIILKVIGQNASGISVQYWRHFWVRKGFGRRHSSLSRPPQDCKPFQRGWSHRKNPCGSDSKLTTAPASILRAQRLDAAPVAQAYILFGRQSYSISWGQLADAVLAGRRLLWTGYFSVQLRCAAEVSLPSPGRFGLI